MLKDLTRADLPRLVVLSQREIPRDTPVESFGLVVEDDAPGRHHGRDVGFRSIEHKAGMRM